MDDKVTGAPWLALIEVNKGTDETTKNKPNCDATRSDYVAKIRDPRNK